jgi:hypothetical protein
MERYRYRFGAAVPPEDIEASLLLAVASAESLYGETQVRLDVAYDFDPEAGTLVIDAATPAGRDVNRLFTGFVRTQLGEGMFFVDRLTQPQEATTP